MTATPDFIDNRDGNTLAQALGAVLGVSPSGGLAGRLACPDDHFAVWAAAVGCGPLAADEKENVIHELDAVVAHLYGLTEPQLVHIFEIFHEGWDYEDQLSAVLGHYDAWKGKVG